MLTYNNVSEDAWNRILNAVAQYGITINDDSGTKSASGFTIGWNYNRAAETLATQCLDSPFWISCSTINSHINDAVENCLNQHQIALAPIVPR
jgi:hypothetical protein